MKAFAWTWSRLKNFGLFWKDFLIGDNPEFLIGSIIIIGLAFAVRESALLASILMPIAVILLLSFGVRNGKRN
jgi:hypothetical protein